MPLSLRKLCNSFNTSEKKGFFPHKFVNLDNLHYFGDKPDYCYYNDISLEDYNKIKKSYWSLRDSCLDYLTSDIFSLYQILDTFSNYIFRPLALTKYYRIFNFT